MNPMSRRLWLATATTSVLAACASPAVMPGDGAQPFPPIVFVHGNGDNAALWTTTLWRFESQGWPRDRLLAVDLPDPLARDDDTVAQPGRSSTAEAAGALAAEVDALLRRTGAHKVVLMGNSRGGYAIRNYIQNFGGAAKVAKVVLGGTPNHGVWANAKFRPNNEFNGAGPFLTGLNAPKGVNGDEVTPGVEWMTIRSDHNDKYAQPDGVWIGARGTPTNVGFDGPALKGATNIVLPGRDHRETSFHPQSFARSFEFITGHAPTHTTITPEAHPLLDGRIFDATNHAIVGATLQIYAVDPATGARRGAALLDKTVAGDGRWGPFQAANDAFYEFVIGAPGYAITHVYRSPFPRSSAIVNFRPEHLADADKDAAALLLFTRPRGYFGVPRDHIVFDGISPPADLPHGVAGVSTSKLKLHDGVGRAVVASFDSGPLHERLAGTAWPAAGNHVVVLELSD
jgi:pimeloyl-ACP methyl ester carboxylesterase